MMTITFTSQCNKKWNILLKVYSSTFRKPSLFLLLTFFAAFFSLFLACNMLQLLLLLRALVFRLAKAKNDELHFIFYIYYVRTVCVCVQQAYRKIPYVQCERWMILEIPNKFKQQSIILLCVTNFPSSLSIGFTGSFISFATPQHILHSAGWLAISHPLHQIRWLSICSGCQSFSLSLSHTHLLLLSNSEAWQKFTFILLC